MLEFAILGLLKERTMHGYDLRKRLREDFGPLSNFSFGSLYPALARLEASGAIAVVNGRPADETVADLAIASTGSLSGDRAATVARRATAKMAETLGARGPRGRKIYEITPAGQALFEELLETPSGGDTDPRGFSLRLAFARHLSPQARIRLLERRRLELSDRLRQSSAQLSSPRRSLDPYERSLAEHARESVAHDLNWIEGLLEAEVHAVASTPAPIAGRPGDEPGSDDSGGPSADNHPRHAQLGVALTSDGGSNA